MPFTLPDFHFNFPCSRSHIALHCVVEQNFNSPPNLFELLFHAMLRVGVVLQPQRTKQYAYRLDLIDTAAAVAVVGRFLPMEMAAGIIAPERSPQGAFFRGRW